MQDLLLKAKHLDAVKDDLHAAATFLRSSPLQRVLSRAVYDEEYEVIHPPWCHGMPLTVPLSQATLQQCMQGAPGGDLMLQASLNAVARAQQVTLRLTGPS